MNFRRIFPALLEIVSLSLLCLLGMSVLIPVQAATNMESTQLETEVLQIIRNHPETIIESVQAYQEQQRQQQQQARQTFLQQLKTDPQSVIGESPVTDSVKGKTVLIEFSDFQCPYCRQAYDTLKQFQDAHQDEVILVYKHFPLSSIHPEAISAAKAAWAAGQQGKFWPYYDDLFVQQDQLGEKLYLDIAQKLNLNLTQFNQDRAGVVADAAIEKDIQMAETLGIQGTPFFAMNGEFFSGVVPLSVLEETLLKN